MLVQLYNTNDVDGSGGNATVNNPFSKVNVPSNTTNPNNPFGSKPALLPNPFASGGANGSGASGIFGGSLASTGAGGQNAQQANPFASNVGGGIFGNGGTANTTAGGNIFGAAVSGAANAQSSIFGGGIGATAGGQTTSFFNSAAPATGSIFGQPQQPSGAAASANIFGGSSAFAAPAFGAAPTFASAPAAGGNIFGGGAIAQPQQQQQTNIFGGGVVGGGASAFGAQPQQQQSSIFGAPAVAPSIFADPNNSMQFGANVPTASATAATTANVFGNATFGGQEQSVFGASSNVFGNPPAAAPAANSSVFGSNSMSAPANPFGGGQQLQQQAGGGGVGEPSAYSRMEDLTDLEMQAFNAEKFELGAIPVHPPPQQLCSS